MPRRLPQSGNFDNPPATDSPQTTSDPAHAILDAVQVAEGTMLDILQDSDALSPTAELERAIERPHGEPARAGDNRETTATAPQQDISLEERIFEREREREWQQQLRIHETLRLAALQHAASLVARQPNPTASEPRETNSPRDRAALRIASMSARRGRSPRHPIPEGQRMVRGMEDSARSAEAGSMRLTDIMNSGTRQLENSVSSLRFLLDDTVPSISSSRLSSSSPTLEEQEYSGEAEHNRRAKRRKLDTDKTDSEFKGFKYGRYGQVEPGKLKMEIVSCDGGMYDEHPSGNNYAAENVLRNDGTVYCTKSNRCNLVLRHQGATVFSLKELIIKAPHSGYTAPVQEGMIFISMTSDDLLARTAQYQIQYSPARNRRSGSAHSNDLPPIISIRHNGDGSMTTAQVNARRLYDIGLQDEDCDYRTAQIPSEFTADAPPFQVTTECSDDEGDEAARPMHRRAFHRNFLPQFDSDSSDSDWGDTIDQHGSAHEQNILFPINRSHRQRLRRRETASNITLAEAAEARQVPTQETMRAVGGELMVPHARFFIERDKSKCTVRFDPPVSGRFILLKMWSPHQSATSNIDIQSVVAKGFAGPRFFPAVDMR